MGYKRDIPLRFTRNMFIDKYVGKARVIADHSEKKDHQTLEIVKPKLRELNPASFTPNDFRLPDTVNNHMFYQYEILGTLYVYVVNDGVEQLVMQIDVIDVLAVDDNDLKDLVLGATDLYVEKELDLGSGYEMNRRKKLTSLIRSLVLL